jgi:tetratricopeptide (TPR) repeat protein
LYHAKRYNEALQALAQAVTLHPLNTTARIDLARTLEAMGRYAEAIATAQESLRIMREAESAPVGSAKSRGELVRALVIAARSWQGLQRWDEALTTADEGLTLAPEQPDLWYVRYAALDCLNQPEEALAAAKRVTEVQPMALVGWKNAIALLSDLRRFEEALEMVEQALEPVPTDDELRGQHALLVAQLVAQGKLPHTALANVEADLDDPEIWVMTARNLAFLNDPEAVLQACDEGLRRLPTKVDLYGIKVRALMGLPRYREALAPLREALRTAKPNHMVGHEFSEPKSKSTSERL